MTTSVILTLALLALATGGVAGCGGGGSGGSGGGASVRELLALPEHFAEPAIPAENPLTAAKIALGRRLFHDTQLSGNGTQSCASCHQQALAFSDGRATPLGSTGAAHPRNSQGLANAAYFSTMTWGNNGLLELEQQIHVPIHRARRAGRDPRRGAGALRRGSHLPAPVRRRLPGISRKAVRRSPCARSSSPWPASAAP